MAYLIYIYYMIFKKFLTEFKIENMVKLKEKKHFSEP